MLDISGNLTASVSVFYLHDPTDGPRRPVASSAQEIVESGLGVELFLSEYNFVPYAHDQIDRLREIARAAKLVTCHTDQFGWDRQKLEAEIPFAAGLGGSILVVHAATFGLERCHNPPPPSLLRDICKRAADWGVRIAFENSGRTGIAMMRRAIDTIGPDLESIGMGICIDTGHANRSAKLDGLYAQDYLREFRELIIEVHINDNLGEKDLHLPPGEGNIDWDAVLPELHALPDPAVLCIELAKPDGEPMAALRKSCEFLCGLRAATPVT